MIRYLPRSLLCLFHLNHFRNMINHNTTEGGLPVSDLNNDILKYIIKKKIITKNIYMKLEPNHSDSIHSCQGNISYMHAQLLLS